MQAIEGSPDAFFSCHGLHHLTGKHHYASIIRVKEKILRIKISNISAMSDEKVCRQLAEQAYHSAYELDLKYGCCPQCVLSAVSEAIGAEVTDELIKASHGLSGGGALFSTGMCGALTGGLLALGARYGREVAHFDSGPGLENFRMGKRLVDLFLTEFGGITCEYLQHKFSGRTWNFWNASEYIAFALARGDQCARVSGLVAKWVVEILLSDVKSIDPF